jgi:hypothetical protein
MRAVLVVMVLARGAAAQPALADSPVELLVDKPPQSSAVPVRLIPGATIDRTTGTASFDWGTSRFVVRVLRSGPHFFGDLDGVAQNDAIDRGIDVAHSIVEVIDGRVVITPPVVPNALHELVPIELAYVPWDHSATVLVFYTDATGSLRRPWLALARKTVISTQVEPATSFQSIGPFVMKLPRLARVRQLPHFVELDVGRSFCLLKSIDDPEGPVAPKDALGLDDHTLASDETSRLWYELPDVVSIELTAQSARLRLRCVTHGESAMKTIFSILVTSFRPPHLPALDQIRSLLRQSS